MLESQSSEAEPPTVGDMRKTLRRDISNQPRGQGGFEEHTVTEVKRRVFRA